VSRPPIAVYSLVSQSAPARAATPHATFPPDAVTIRLCSSSTQAVPSDLDTGGEAVGWHADTGAAAPITIDALVVGGDMVAAAWPGTLPSGYEAKGLSLYRISGGLLRSTRHASVGNLPS
jgi:hypothetical protein